MQSVDYSISQITDIFNGELLPGGNPKTIITDILIDSRRLISPDNCIFFALISKRNNGHKYISELYNRGIRNYVVSVEPDNYREKFKKANFILVDNTLKGANHA